MVKKIQKMCFYCYTKWLGLLGGNVITQSLDKEISVGKNFSIDRLTIEW